jgi:hypothetical protein
MRLRTLIELLAALLLTFAALFAVSKMARTTAMKVENTYALATIVEVKIGAVNGTLNGAGNALNWFGCTAANIASICGRIN